MCAHKIQGTRCRFFRLICCCYCFCLYRKARLKYELRQLIGCLGTRDENLNCVKTVKQRCGLVLQIMLHAYDYRFEVL